MFSDLFSSLDGAQSFFSWGPSVLVPFFFVSASYFVSSAGQLKNMLSGLIFSRKELNHLGAIISSLLLFLMSINFFGMAPLCYSTSSSLWFASCLAVSFWGALLISGWVYSPTKSAAHLCPSGAPVYLVPVLVVIETISILIRPITLSVRLIANISAGHIVLSLLSNVLSGTTVFFVLALSLVGVFYTVFEFFVCFIQAYIFSLLVSLYAEEHP
uniref:ATP synthase subunit a n=1 Tax=Pedipes pedipes TaxID=999235 RepID=G8HPB7_9EUPU|nr:ATP synthase F0 subunit 6 [Pedipes pedipes]AEQ93852.1 ATP synthase subunit 6 [Pedipes pedipes]